MFNFRRIDDLPLRLLQLYVISILHSIFALMVAIILFPSASGLVSLFLLTFGLLGIFDRILLENKEAIWERKENPNEVNLRTALHIMAIFLGVLTYYFFVVSYLPKDVSLRQLAKQLEGALTTLSPEKFAATSVILKNNITVLYLFFFFSICYRAGALFVIIWNASVWGATFGFFTKIWYSLDFLQIAINLLKLAVTVLPHLLLEAVGYILAAMSGLFFSKAARKYSIDSDPFRQVLQASISLILLSSVMIFVGALVETNFAPRMIEYFFHS